MPSNPDSQFAFRSLELAEYYDENFNLAPTPIGSRSQAAKRDIERYRHLLEVSLPTFSEDEAIALWDALNGCSTNDVETLGVLQQGIATELDRKLAQRIKALSFIEWLAVVDACDRVGANGYQIENLTKELKRVGLISIALI